MFLLENDFKSARIYNADLYEGTNKEFLQVGLILDAVKEIMCDEENLFALVGHGFALTATTSVPQGFLILAKLVDGKSFDSIIYSIIDFGTDIVLQLKGDVQRKSSSAYIEQPGKNKVLYISYRNSKKNICNADK